MASQYEDEDDNLSRMMQNTSIQEERRPFSGPQSNSSRQRRGINSHLYTKPGRGGRGGNQNERSNNRGGGGGGGGRGRGRGRGGRGGGGFSQNQYQDRNGNNSDEENSRGHPANNGFTYKPNNENYNPPPQRSNGYMHENRPQKKKNTETFKPSHKPSDMRITAAFARNKEYTREITSRDVIAVHGLFCEEDDLTIYEKLLEETKDCGIDHNALWQLWHGDTHLIADDKTKWKDSCPTFRMVLEKIQDYFNMNIQATRLNWYRDSREWKPFHHDAAAINPEKAKVQNFTVAVSFGAERDAAFEHATTRTVISMPQPNGSVYTFGKDVNVIWRHGILQLPPEKYFDQGRISIIAWGAVKQTQVPCFYYNNLYRFNHQNITVKYFNIHSYYIENSLIESVKTQMSYLLPTK